MPKAKTIVGFGEVMIRLSPAGQQAFGDSSTILMAAGGSEANVLAKLSCFSPHFQGELVTALNDDMAGRVIAAELHKHKIDTSHVRWTKDRRNGIYFLEQGIGPIVARVDYDRAGSAIAQLAPDEKLFDVLDGAAALFISGITPALSPACAANTELALKRARATGVPVFFDVNFRKKLWSAAEACKTLDHYLRNGRITGLITTETDARTVFGIDRGVDDTSPIETLIERSRLVLGDLKARYAGQCQLYIITIRKRITNETGVWTSAALLPDGAYLVGDVFDYVILDRPGAGDSCSAGIVAGYLGIQRDGSLQDAPLPARIKMGLDLGNRAAIVAQKTVGDLGPAWDAAMYFNRVSESKEIAR